MIEGGRAGGRTGALLLLLVAVLTGCAAAPAPAGPAVRPADDPAARRLAAAVSADGAFAHLEALARIADERGGNRDAPGPGYDASVDYVAGVLRDAGYDVSTPTYRAAVEGPDGEERAVELRQVVAQTRTGDPGRVVLAGAHLDSVEEGPGINDNGTGVAALLEIATRLGGSPQAEKAVRFAFWGSEEDELDGSTAYAAGLTDPDRLALYLNVDMLGSPNAGYFVQGGTGDDEDAAGPAGSAEVAQVLADELAAVGVTAERLEFDGSSDYDAFLTAGVASAGLLTGDEDDKTPEQARAWGGRAGAPYDACYHAACDRLDNVDRTALDRTTDAVAATLARFAL